MKCIFSLYARLVFDFANCAFCYFVTCVQLCNITGAEKIRVKLPFSEFHDTLLECLICEYY
jgi:hypothetical protein